MGLEYFWENIIRVFVFEKSKESCFMYLFVLLSYEIFFGNFFLISWFRIG